MHVHGVYFVGYSININISWQVVKWFAERSDLILLVFDAHKLDMGQEFREVMSVIAKHGDRVS